MENKDINSKKDHDKQNTNEAFSGKHMADKEKIQDSILTDEVEIDAEGNKVIVQRARNVDGSVAHIPDEERTWNENESLSRGVATEEEAMKTVENEDLNSDITANRYPTSHPDNHKDRGNMKLDDE
ncbi:hypothetical protein [uncultured Flavobacterium sp.]|jgi:hypothetical protein|uniref:hypothetical protein n=1 Tax=uncultured Flavobacterium sp. TaxID=165435 RepID=UPI0030EC6613|tara:strand:- start:27017 stop:27394 length:378 start_codon:yes stop_codon:yes gene_type:complete